MNDFIKRMNSSRSAPVIVGYSLPSMKYVLERRHNGLLVCVTSHNGLHACVTNFNRWHEALDGKQASHLSRHVIENCCKTVHNLFKTYWPDVHRILRYLSMQL